MKIEWRAWDKEFNCWAEPDKVWMNQDGEVWRNGVDWTERYHFMLYTGLHDKNGQKIYEGDLIDGPRYINGPLVVIWREGMACMALRHLDGKCSSFGLWDELVSDLFKVIGNIYDNQEMIHGRTAR